MERYDLWQRDGEGYLKEAKYGQWCRHEDVKDLQAQLDRAFEVLHHRDVFMAPMFDYIDERDKYIKEGK